MNKSVLRGHSVQAEEGMKAGILGWFSFSLARARRTGGGFDYDMTQYACKDQLPLPSPRLPKKNCLFLHCKIHLSTIDLTNAYCQLCPKHSMVNKIVTGRTCPLRTYSPVGTQRWLQRSVTSPVIREEQSIQVQYEDRAGTLTRLRKSGKASWKKCYLIEPLSMEVRHIRRE